MMTLTYPNKPLSDREDTFIQADLQESDPHVFKVQELIQPTMTDEPKCQLRRRRSSGNPNLPLNLEVAFQVNEGGPSQGTPSPSCFKQIDDSSKEAQRSSAMAEFRKKQQSFDIQIEECEEEEIIVDSDEEEGSDLAAASGVNRPVTPTPIQDFGANVVYTEGPQVMDFLKVNKIDNDCITDVSDADDDEEE